MNTLSHPSTPIVASSSRTLLRLLRAARDWVQNVQQARRARAALVLEYQAMRQLDGATLRDLGLADRSALQGSEPVPFDRRVLWP